MIHVVQLFAVCQQSRDSVYCSFEWFSSISLSAMIRLQFMVHAGRLVHPVVQLLVQLVRSFSLCMQSIDSLSLTSNPQPILLNTIVDCWDFLPIERGLYNVKIFYPDYIYNVHIGIFTYFKE